MSKKYLNTKEGSLEDKITQIAKEQSTIKLEKPEVELQAKSYFETKPGSISDLASKIVSNVKEDLDPVNKNAVKKKFDNRKDKDIDNDGDVDSSDKFLHKRRKAISKSMSENKRRSTTLIGPSKDNIKKLNLVRKGNLVYDKSGKYYGFVDKVYYMGKDTPFLHKVTGVEGKPFSQSPPVYKHQRPKGIKYQPSTSGITGKRFAGEELDKATNNKSFKEMRIKMGEKGKTMTGKDAAVIDTEPRANPI